MNSWTADDIGENGEIIFVKPMTEVQLGRYYICVMDCQHSPQITIKSNGVWVKTGALYSSAHRDCYERGVTGS